MKLFAVPLLGFAVLALPLVTAQDAKDDKKPEEKKVDKKEGPRPVDESVVLAGTKVHGMVRSIKTEGVPEITVTTMSTDKKKLAEFAQWDRKSQTEVLKSKDKKARLAQYLTDKQSKIDALLYSGEEKILTLHEAVRVRTSQAIVLDKDGSPKPKPTPAEVSALKGTGTRLPGYRAKMENVRVGQIVDLYVGKVTAAKAAAPVLKKAPIGADPSQVAGPAGPKLDVLLIYVVQDTP